MAKTCVLAYSGGLDTTAIIPWLKETYDVEVIAYCCNIGNLPPENDLKERALSLGATEFVYEDAREEFVSDYIYPLLRSGSKYLDDYLLGTAIARPLIAARVAAFAENRKAEYIAHGATGKGNDHIRFERAWSYLCPEKNIFAPWKTWEFRGREDLIAYLMNRGFSWTERRKTYSVDENSFHRSSEGGDLEDIERDYREKDVVQWLDLSPKRSPIEISATVEEGKITELDGISMSPLTVIESLNKIGSEFGIGLCDIVEERANGIKSRGVYETPGGTIAHEILKALKQICWSRELYQMSQFMSHQYANAIYDGKWFSDHRAAIDKFFEHSCENLTGEVRLRMSPQALRVTSRKGPFSLYDTDTVSFETDSMNIHHASLGYSKIMTLSSKIQGQRARKLK